jgi:hypothetical protein
VVPDLTRPSAIDGGPERDDHRGVDEPRRTQDTNAVEPEPGVDEEPEPGPDEELDPREAARDRRRDREAEAERRALMRSGMGKVFKQILDRQERDVDEPPARRGRHRT